MQSGGLVLYLFEHLANLSVLSKNEILIVIRFTACPDSYRGSERGFGGETRCVAPRFSSKSALFSRCARLANRGFAPDPLF